MRDANIDQCVIFTATKAMTETLADELYEKGFSANCLHGDTPQGWRNRTLMDVRKGRCNILVATDVAGRGIHVDDVVCVVNFTLPDSPDDYVHRIGRTGRAGNKGVSISFVSEDDGFNLPAIQSYLDSPIKMEQW